MHEFSLYSQIPAARHGQVLQILAGVTASQPTPTLEQTLIYQQARLTETGTSKKVPVGRQNAVPASRLSYHKLVRDLKGTEGEKGPWTFRAEDVPLPGMPSFVSRATTESVLGEAQLEKFRQGNGWYKYVQHLCHLLAYASLIRLQIHQPIPCNTRPPLRPQQHHHPYQSHPLRTRGDRSAGATRRADPHALRL